MSKSKDPKVKKSPPRGAEALSKIDSVGAKTERPPVAIQHIPISRIKANPSNPRVIRDEKFVCNNCGNNFQSRKACKSRQPKFCSKKCYGDSLRKPKALKIPAPSRKGVPLSEAWRKAVSAGRKASDKCKGPNLYNWKGGAATLADRYRQHNRNRWQRIRGAGPLPLAYLAAVRRAQRNRCFYCDRPLGSGRATHIEHLTPISRGGTNDWHNLVYSCQPCNNSKRSKTLMEFAIHRMQPNLIDKSILIQCAAKRAVDRLIPRHASAVN